MTRAINTLAWFSVTTLLALVASQTPAQAQIPSAAGVYTACMRVDRDGDEGRVVRLVAANEPCRRNEVRITWNQQGQKGDKGDTGPQGLQGLTGPTGATGAKGDTGAQGPKGDTGAQGPKGDTGAVGPQGSKGDTGAVGPQGVKGDAGADGAVGPAGPQGAQGIAGLNFRGGFNPNDTYAQFDVVASNGSAYVAGVNPTGDPADPQSSNWQLLASKGDTGVKGDAGATGAQGPIGLTGATGATGPQGPQGLTGATGATGPQGPKGDKGDTGATGPQGLQGLTGATGATGPQGPQGIAGLNFRGAYDSNAAYAQFDVVESNGSAYVAGVNPTGDPALPQSSNWQLLASKGAAGAAGAQGPQGPAGQNGTNGLTGPQGPQGIQGPQGQTGSQGYSVTVGSAPNGACPNGGTQVQDGFNHTQYVCNGKDGTNGASFLNMGWFSQTTQTSTYNSLATSFTLASSTRVLISASVPMASPNYYGAQVGCFISIDGSQQFAPVAISLPGVGQMYGSAYGAGLFTSSQVYGPLAPGSHSAWVTCSVLYGLPVIFDYSNFGSSLTQVSVLQVQ